MSTVLLLQGEIIGDVKVLSLQGNEVVIELQMPVSVERTYQILIDGIQYNLEFTKINANIQTHQTAYCQARGFIFR